MVRSAIIMLCLILMSLAVLSFYLYRKKMFDGSIVKKFTNTIQHKASPTKTHKEYDENGFVRTI